MKIQLYTNGNSYLNGGNVGVGTTDPLSKLSVNGDIRATDVKVLPDISVPYYARGRPGTKIAQRDTQIHTGKQASRRDSLYI